MGSLWRGIKGYTVVELLIVLAITGVIFASTVTIFAGRRGDTEFSQAMQDLQSEFQTFSTQVSTSNLPQSNNTYYCSASSSRPFLSTDSSVSNQNECIYLGRAIQVVPNTSVLYIYPVLGFRNVGGSSTGALPATASQSSPEPAVDGSGNPLLYTSYNLLNGAKFKSAAAHFSGSATEEDLLAVYSNLQSGNSSGNDTTAFARSRTFSDDGNVPPQFSALKSCVEEASCGSATNLSAVNVWNLCVTDANGTRTASLNLKASAVGLTTSLNMDACP